ncbi:hybrid sensor histidine kinase/response regulator [Desulfomicrobium baculatum]|uniref:histidine kinase n=1 Tax=Desulfomicrobium baculatum (strain DSM 4028 / VKM B-1378 / X) TaxID=525897 RepID=C7LUE0_DESBD|nr:ATP-binding protein [Desulfomicrobium baculatum]ACU89675.1 PAS/PAC sensor hybrid histidine kinase [Desulfomicrobium baculatum DSM 4028]
MDLKFRANLTGFILVASITLGISGLATLTIDHLTETLNFRLLDKELDEYREKIFESRKVLDGVGLLGIRDYEDKAKADLLASFKARAPKMFGQLGIVSSRGEAVMYVGLPGEQNFELSCLPELLRIGAGRIDCVTGQETRIGPYLFIPEWDWLLMVTVSAEEMRFTRNEFLARVAFIFAIASVFGWWFYVRAARAVLDPVLDLSRAATEISRGDWQGLPEPLARKDEIGELSRNFVAMARRLRDSQADLTRQAASLRESNIHLEAQITERVRVEHDLRKATTSFMGIFDSSPSVLIAVDCGCVVAHWNRTARTWVGLEPEQVIGLPLEQALPQLAWLVDTVRRSMDEATTLSLTRQSYEQAEERRTVDILVSPLISDEVYGAVIRLDDVTAQIRMEEGLIAAKKSAESANEAKSEFLANMSHELRTPFSGIMGMMRLLQGTGLDDEQRRYVCLAIKASDRFTRLLTDLLDISRIEAGKLDIHEQEFSTSDLHDSVMEIFALASQEKGISLEFFIDPSVPARLVGDEMRVRQILFNLVGNAIKFTEKGCVCVEIILLSPVKGADLRVLFTVSDTGIGIPVDMLSGIFGSFVQVDGASSRAFQGAGLGLAIVKRLVKLMGGQIFADSIEGEGTNMHVELPFKMAGSRAGESKSRLDTGSTVPRLHILLVEDEPIITLYTRKLLEKAGHQVTTAENGLEIFGLPDRDTIDCIFMDIQMPVMDGIEATHAIRSSSRPGYAKDIPIIALTAHAMIGDREKFLGLGMDGYLTKPVDANDLQRELERIAAHRSTA